MNLAQFYLSFIAVKTPSVCNSFACGPGLLASSRQRTLLLYACTGPIARAYDVPHNYMDRLMRALRFPRFKGYVVGRAVAPTACWRAYDAETVRRTMRARGILPLLAMRNTRHGSGLRRWRWVVERTFAWLNQFRRLRARYEKRADIHTAFLSLGCILICWRRLQDRLR